MSIFYVTKVINTLVKEGDILLKWLDSNNLTQTAFVKKIDSNRETLYKNIKNQKISDGIRHKIAMAGYDIPELKIVSIQRRSMPPVEDDDLNENVNRLLKRMMKLEDRVDELEGRVKELEG